MIETPMANQQDGGSVEITKLVLLEPKNFFYFITTTVKTKKKLNVF